MAKGDGYLSVAMSVMGRDDTKAMADEIAKQLRKMATAEVNKAFMRMSSSTTTATTAMTGLRTALGTIDPRWKFGTVYRNDVTGERVMAVGHRQVTGLRPPYTGVADTTEDWFDRWEVEQDT